eukprot:TRINITY_DN2549_c0_g1_i1.p1 TRINITY_DN2549_c0_g1~~TRINITY_DN2549_c0_g1_i1.p1  ORF type:complete len:639 (-),score=99.82 TRINITY_DN2549_c0_g1_i1:322-2160(-)
MEASKLPGTVDEPGDHADVAEKVAAKAGELTDAALETMTEQAKKLDKRVPESSCCSGILKRILSFKDPVQGPRCSIGRLGFASLAMFALVIMIIEGVDEDWVELAAAAFVMLLALFVTIFVGGDLFMFDAFKALVNGMQRRLRHLTRNVDFYENKLTELNPVSEGLEAVYNQMGGDIQATTVLLTDMEKFGKMQTVSAVVSQFFAADYDGSGHISGEEAELLFPHITILWDLLPDFDRARVIDHVRIYGITLAQFSKILDGLVSSDKDVCAQALDLLLNGQLTKSGRIDVEKGSPQPPEFSDEPKHGAAYVDSDVQVFEGRDQRFLVTSTKIGFARVSDSAGAELDDLDVDLESQRRGPARLCEDAAHRSSAPAPDTGDADSEVEEEALKPIFSIPVPVNKVGPFTVGGRMSVWGLWHLLALLCVPISIVFLILLFYGMEVTNIVLGVFGTCLAIGLTGAGKMIEVLRILRKQYKELTYQNSRMEGLNIDLADKVAKLSKLQHGFEKLQELCAGNVEKAKQLISESNAKIKMEAMAVVMHLFKHADANRNFKLEHDEKEEFAKNIALVFRQLPGFDIDSVQSHLDADVITTKVVKNIVDAISRFDTAPNENE